MYHLKIIRRSVSLARWNSGLEEKEDKEITVLESMRQARGQYCGQAFLHRPPTLPLANTGMLQSHSASQILALVQTTKFHGLANFLV